METYARASGIFDEIQSILNKRGYEYRERGARLVLPGRDHRTRRHNHPLRGIQSRTERVLRWPKIFKAGWAGKWRGQTSVPRQHGIGTLGNGTLINCLALQTDRCDVQLLALENPEQTSAYLYAHQFAPHAPRFSRAMALIAGRFVTTWISGTASIRNSETTHVGDIGAQTEQTLDNIEGLMARENFARHGVAQVGAWLSDLARVRVYIKRIEDYAECKRVCERRLGDVPALYVLADVCRPELLVEIEGVAFTEKG